jgi:hypothetical protein
MLPDHAAPLAPAPFPHGQIHSTFRIARQPYSSRDHGCSDGSLAEGKRLAKREKSRALPAQKLDVASSIADK